MVPVLENTKITNNPILTAFNIFHHFTFSSFFGNQLIGCVISKLYYAGALKCEFVKKIKKL